MIHKFKQTEEISKIIEKMYSDEGLVDMEIERVRGNKLMLYCVYKGIRLLEMGPIPVAVGDVVNIEGLRIRIEMPQ